MRNDAAHRFTMRNVARTLAAALALAGSVATPPPFMIQTECDLQSLPYVKEVIPVPLSSTHALNPVNAKQSVSISKSVARAIMFHTNATTDCYYNMMGQCSLCGAARLFGVATEVDCDTVFTSDDAQDVAAVRVSLYSTSLTGSQYLPDAELWSAVVYPGVARTYYKQSNNAKLVADIFDPGVYADSCDVDMYLTDETLQAGSHAIRSSLIAPTAAYPALQPGVMYALVLEVDDISQAGSMTLATQDAPAITDDSFIAPLNSYPRYAAPATGTSAAVRIGGVWAASPESERMALSVIISEFTADAVNSAYTYQLHTRTSGRVANQQGETCVKDMPPTMCNGMAYDTGTTTRAMELNSTHALVWFFENTWPSSQLVLSEFSLRWSEVPTEFPYDFDGEITFYPAKPVDGTNVFTPEKEYTIDAASASVCTVAATISPSDPFGPGWLITVSPQGGDTYFNGCILSSGTVYGVSLKLGVQTTGCTSAAGGACAATKRTFNVSGADGVTRSTMALRRGSGYITVANGVHTRVGITPAATLTFSIACPAGQHVQGGLTPSCVQCAPGYYCPAGVFFSPPMCPTGQTSNAGASAASDCHAMGGGGGGGGSGGGGGGGVTCTMGSYPSGNGCAQCPNCHMCPNGVQMPIACPPGYIHSPYRNICIPGTGCLAAPPTETVLIAYGLTSPDVCSATAVVDKVLSPDTGVGVQMRADYAAVLGYDPSKAFITGVIACDGQRFDVAKNDPVNLAFPTDDIPARRLEVLDVSVRGSASRRHRALTDISYLSIELDGQTVVLELGISVPQPVAASLANFLKVSMTTNDPTALQAAASALAAAINSQAMSAYTGPLALPASLTNTVIAVQSTGNNVLGPSLSAVPTNTVPVLLAAMGLAPSVQVNATALGDAARVRSAGGASSPAGDSSGADPALGALVLIPVALGACAAYYFCVYRKKRAAQRIAKHVPPAEESKPAPAAAAAAAEGEAEGGDAEEGGKGNTAGRFQSLNPMIKAGATKDPQPSAAPAAPAVTAV